MLNFILLIAVVYLFCGVIFSIAFLLKGITVTDEGTAGTSIGFRIIILPGLITLWPFLLRRWMKIAGNNKVRKSA